MADGFNQKRKTRRSYYDDYKKTASGEYVYMGAMYEFSGARGKTRKRWVTELLLLGIVIFAVLLVPGFMLVPGLNHCAYVLLPYGLGVLGAGYLVFITVRLAAAGDEVKAWEYDKSVKVMPAAVKIVCAVSAANIVCEGVYLIINGAEGLVAGACVYMAAQAVSAVLAYFAVRLVKDGTWTEKECADG